MNRYEKHRPIVTGIFFPAILVAGICLGLFQGELAAQVYVKKPIIEKKSKGRKYGVPVATTAPGGPTAPGEETAPVLTVDQIVQIALQRNPALTISERSVDAADSRAKQVRSHYFPHLDTKVGFYRFWMDLVSWADQFQQAFPANENFPQATIILSQYIYDFGKTDGRYVRNVHLRKASQKSYRQTLEDVIQVAKIAFYNVLRSHQYVVVQQQSVGIYAKHLTQARDFLSAGMRPEIDVTKAEVAFSKSKRSLMKSQYAAQLSKVLLENVLAGPPVPGPYQLGRPADLNPEKEQMDGLVEEALKQRPKIAVLQERIIAARAQVRAVWGDYLPSVTAQAAFDWQDAQIAFYNHAYILGVGMKWNLFAGLRTYEEVREAKAVKDRLAAQLQKEELQVKREVNEAVIHINENVDDVLTSEVIVKEARQSRELAEGRYENGLGDYLEFQDAVLTWRQAENDLIQAQFSYLQSRADLDHALGRTEAYAPMTKKE